MRAIPLVLLALLAAGCAAGPDESTDDAAAGADCPEDASAYHEAGTEGQATGDASDACPEGLDEDSTKETATTR